MITRVSLCVCVCIFISTQVLIDSLPVSSAYKTTAWYIFMHLFKRKLSARRWEFESYVRFFMSSLRADRFPLGHGSLGSHKGG